MNNRKVFSVAAAAAVIFLLALAAGCSSSGSKDSKESAVSPSNAGSTTTPQATNSDQAKQVTLRIAWWGSQDRADRTLKAIKLFEEKNPNIKISAEFLGWDGYWQKMATMAAGKNLPDILQMDDSYVPDYIQRGLLTDMTPYEKSGALDLSDVDDGFIARGIIDGKLYALCIGATAQAIAYDPAMFAKAGVPELMPGYTWDDYANTARLLQEKLGNEIYGTTLDDGVNGFKLYLMENGAYLYNEAGTGLGYDKDQYMIDWFTYWNKLRDDKVAPAPDQTANLTALEDSLIVHQKAPFLGFYSNQIVALTKSANRPLKLMEYPIDPGGEKPQYLKSSQHFSISSTSKLKDEAIKFINFVTNDLEANEALGGERGVPVSSKVREHLKPSLGEAAAVLFDYVDYVGKNFPPFTNRDPAAATEINGSLFQSITDKVNYGQITPEQAAVQFREQATKIFEKNK